LKVDQELISEEANDHEWCLICGSQNPHSLKLRFEPDELGVKAEFTPSRDLQGYSGILHGGIVSALLDSAMTHCLFNSGIKAVTGDLHVRFLHSVPCNQPLEIRALIVSSRPPLYRLKSELLQGSRIMAWAEAKFMRQEPGR
jgi:acyl-coenzyme A thioesterase PaaI-like protein